MSMLLRLGLTVVLALTCIITACVPERVSWSPDGTHAAVTAGDGLRLVTPQGVLSNLLIKDAVEAEWLPDGKHVVVVRFTQATTWKDAAAHLSEDQQAEVAKAAGVLRNIMQSWEGTPEDLGDTLRVLVAERYNHLGVLLLMTLHDTNKELVARKLGRPGDVLQAPAADLSLVERYRVEDGQAVLVGKLATVPGNAELVASPDGKYVLILAQSRMLVAPADGSSPATVLAKDTGVSADWSPDSRHVVYVHSFGNPQEGASLATIRQIQVRDPKGKFAPGNEGKELCTIAYSPSVRVRYLGNGRVVFSAQDITLPVRADTEKAPSLYALQVDKALADDEVGGKPVEILSAQEADDLPLWLFSVSPDRKRLAIVGMNKKVGVFDVAAEKLTLVQDEESSGDGESGLGTIPAWRNADELTFAEPLDGGKLQLVLYSLKTGKKQVLSKDWPDEAQSGFLTKPPEAQRPTSTQPLEIKMPLTTLPELQPATLPATRPATQP